MKTLDFLMAMNSVGCVIESETGSCGFFLFLRKGYEILIVMEKVVDYEKQ